VAPLFFAVTWGHFSHTFLSYYRPPLGAVALHSLFLYSDMPTHHPSSFRLAQTSLEANLYLYKYPSGLVPLILLLHMTYGDGTDRVFQNISTYKGVSKSSQTGPID
jgi:hypothetical protein